MSKSNTNADHFDQFFKILDELTTNSERKRRTLDDKNHELASMIIRETHHTESPETGYLYRALEIEAAFMDTAMPMQLCWFGEISDRIIEKNEKSAMPGYDWLCFVAIYELDDNSFMVWKILAETSCCWNCDGCVFVPDLVERGESSDYHFKNEIVDEISDIRDNTNTFDVRRYAAIPTGIKFMSKSSLDKDLPDLDLSGEIVTDQIDAIVEASQLRARKRIESQRKHGKARIVQNQTKTKRSRSNNKSKSESNNKSNAMDVETNNRTRRTYPSRGVQDKYLTDKPMIKFFEVKFVKHTNFGMESAEQKFEAGPTGTEYTANSFLGGDPNLGPVGMTGHRSSSSSA